MSEHTIQEGDCITSIAGRHGLHWKTIWDHPENAELKRRRQDPNVLMPGDIVFVPEKDEKWETAGTETRHRFCVKGVPAKLRLRLMRPPDPQHRPPARQATQQYPPPKEVTTEDPVHEAEPREEEPLAGIRYVVVIDGKLTEGQTDGEGRLEVSIPPGAREGRLVIEPGTDNERTMQLKLGHLDPVTEISGIKQRMANLGFGCGDTSDEETEAFRAAVRDFQEKHDLEVTGEVDERTQRTLQDLHGD